MTWILNDKTKNEYVKNVKHVLDENNIANFRKNKSIQDIFEHVREIQAKEYIKKIPVEWLNNHISEIYKNETKFIPEKTMNVCNHNLSTTTTRYAWNCYEIHKYIPVTKDMSVVEIGAGYGGLCRVLCGISGISDYTIIDIPDVSLLAKIFNEAHNVYIKNLSCYDYKSHVKNYDIFISNYALSELDKEEQKGYLEIASKTPYGYITYNAQPNNKHLQYSIDDVKRIISNNRNVEFICHNENITKSENEMIIWRVK